MEIISFVAASETKMMFEGAEANLKDKKLFVENLGKFATQCRNGVERMFLDDNDMVHIIYRRGGEHVVNVRMDSYSALVRHVFTQI
jgi:hypothetical protein